MVTLVYICLTIVAICMGAVYVITPRSAQPATVAIKTGTMLSCFAVALVCANLTSAVGIFSVFVMLAFAALMCAEAIAPLKSPISIGFFAAALACVVVAGFGISQFNAFGVLCGGFVGLGLFCLVTALKKGLKAVNLIELALELVLGGMIAGQGLTLMIKSSYFWAGLLMCVGGALLVASFAARALVKTAEGERRAVDFMLPALYVVGLVCLAFMPALV